MDQLQSWELSELNSIVNTFMEGQSLKGTNLKLTSVLKCNSDSTNCSELRPAEKHLGGEVTLTDFVMISSA